MRFVVAVLLAAACGTAKPHVPTTSAPKPQPKKLARRPTPPPAPTPAPPEDPTAAIKATLDAFADAVARQDPEAIAELHVDGPDTIAVWPGVGEEIVGIDAIRTALGQELPTWESVTFVITDFRIHMLGPKLAYVWGHYDQDLKARPPGARRRVSRRVRGARFFAVMSKEADGWRMLIESGSIPMTDPMWDTIADPPPYELRPRPR